jgi:hypothetical protein
MNLLRRAAEAVISLAVVVMFAGLLGLPDAEEILAEQAA